MASLVYDRIWQDIKQLHLMAFALKECFDKSNDIATIRASWQQFRLKQEDLSKALPWKIRDKGQYQRHCAWLEKRLHEGKPDLCYDDLCALCYNDIPELEKAHLHHLLDTGPSEARYYDWGSIHPVIKNIAKPRFDSKHYADSVEAAFKEINKVVKAAYRTISAEERDGDDLMRKAFSLTRARPGVQKRMPMLRLTDLDLSTDSGCNVQDGYMNLFAGAMRGIRNPKAHDNITIDAAEAWEMIVFGSHLMRMWDRGQAINNINVAPSDDATSAVSQII